MTITMDKQYRTRDGREVRIYAVDGCDKYPVHGAYLTEDGWKVYNWAADGSAYPPWYAEGNNRDLVEVKPSIKREYWLNIYDGTESTALWPSKKRADDQAENNDYRRLACVKIVIDYAEEGEGL